jgi:prolyl oligopeptidase
MDPNHREVPARRLVDPGDKLIEPLWCGDRLLALTNLSHETGALVEVGLADGSLATLAQSDPGEPWVDAAAFSDSVAIATIRDGESRVLVLDNQSGIERHSLTLPDFAGLVGLSTSDDQLFYQFSGFGRPSAIHVLTCSGGHFVDRVFAEAGAADPTVKVERVWVTSTDGTRFPMLLTWRGDTAPNGPTPTVLAGYGGFNVPYLPSYSPSVHDWIMRGGLYAIAMLRGGGEFGEAWHRAGMRANKQAVFDDFYSAARYLVTQGYTDPTHLGVSGRSNGGLLTGAFVTQHPDAASAAIIGVPLLDMVRFHKFLIADLWTAEYGSPDVAEELEWLLAYSPYHHVRENTAYPAILLFTSEDDSRVDPMHARKMTARLQKATTSARPILFRQAAKTGHGVGKSATEWVDEEADIWTFLSYHLGLSVR